MAVALDGMYMSQDDISNPNSRNQPFAEPRVYIPIFAKRAVANFPYSMSSICIRIQLYHVRLQLYDNGTTRVFAVWLRLYRARYTSEQYVSI